MHQPPTVLARARSEHGETVLRRRDDVLELIVDGVFAMDSADPSTERLLATLALADLRPAGTGLRIAIGGLGLGYTLAAVLDDPAVTGVDVIELDPNLVEWARAGLIEPAHRALADPRVRVLPGDVRDLVRDLPAGQIDALLLDVDNGPGFLVHQGNAEVYRPRFLAAAARALRPGGVLAVWSADPAPELQRAVRAALGECAESRHPVSRDCRAFEYAIYLGRLVSRPRADDPFPG